MKFLLELLGVLLGAVKEIAVPILAYYQGKKTKALENQVEILEGAQNSKKTKDAISALPDNVVDDIVFRND